MNFQLDPAILAAITEEARQCFLEEDAPKYLQILKTELQKHSENNLKVMMRAAHSLKGGAGIAKLSSLTDLAHELENLFEALQKELEMDRGLAWELISKGVNELSFCISQARASHIVTADPELLQALSELVPSKLEIDCAELQLPETTTPELSFELETEVELWNGEAGIDLDIIRKTLDQTLEPSFTQIEELPANTDPMIVLQYLQNMCNECLLLGETLKLSWLCEDITNLENRLADTAPEELLGIGKSSIVILRQQCDKFLPHSKTKSEVQSETKSEVQSETKSEVQSETKSEGVEATPETKSETAWMETAINDLRNDLEVDTEIQSAPQSQITTPIMGATSTQVRIPLKKLELMSNNIGELIMTQEHLCLQQKQLEEVNIRLRKLIREFEPIREEVSIVYNRLAVAPSTTEAPATNSDNFDSLEMDSYTDLHTSLQNFQELMLQIQETRTDLDLINRELVEELAQVNFSVNSLNNNVTESRLVAFRTLVQRFLPQIQYLNQRYQKSVHLVLEGEETLIDQVLLEQLQVPLTHILNNAFDHGIESATERYESHKPIIAKILLKASVENNQLVISIADDGRGIDTRKIYRKAVEQGLCSPDLSFKQLSQAEIFNWLFQPTFSTADRLSQLSGRGMGLDVVRNQIRRLRGTIHIDTELGKGTVFSLRLPPNISLMPLLMIKYQKRIIAIPTNSVRESLLYKEIDWLDKQKATVNWQQESIIVFPFPKLLPYTRVPLTDTEPKIGLVVEGANGHFMITADSIVTESQLVVKPFDDTVNVPVYVAGCTILGTGEVIPVILPQALDLSVAIRTQQPVKRMSSNTQKRIPSILVVEDSVTAKWMLQRLLGTMGYQVLLSRDGQEALDTLSQQRDQIDLIICDIEMPRINGLQLLERLRKHDTWKQIPVVMVTSRTGKRHLQRAFDLGVNDYLSKPVQPQKLAETVQSLLSSQ